jgi:hypothetical protein
MRLIKHVNSIYKVSLLQIGAIYECNVFVKIRIAYEWTEDYVIKYLWSAAGYGLIAVPLLFTRTRSLGIQAGSADRKKSRLDDAIAGRTESSLRMCFRLDSLLTDWFSVHFKQTATFISRGCGWACHVCL